MTLDLTKDEAVVLSQALETYWREFEREFVRTDNPRLQHEMKVQSDRLAEVRRKVALVLSGPEVEAPTLM